MSIDLLVAAVLILFLLLLAMRIPVAFSLGIAGSLGLAALEGFEGASLSVGTVPFASTAKLSLAVIPMFIMMGMLAQKAGLPEQLFRIANAKLSKVPGGLAIATVVACAGFGAVTGSSVAAAATMGRLSISEMLRYGYSKPFAAGVVASAGTLGVMIPPSVILVLYAVVTGESIGALLLAGIVPGIITALCYSVYIYLSATLRPHSVWVTETVRASQKAGVGTAGPTTGASAGTGAVSAPTDEAGPLPWRALLWITVIFVIVIGGIYSGVYTATESGAVGAIVVAGMLVWELRRRSFKAIVRGVTDAFRETAATSCMMLAVVIGAALFSTFLVRADVASRFTTWAASFDAPPMAIMGLLVLALIPLGMILESFSLLIIAMPLIHPIAIELGFDGVWLGIIAAKTIEVGLLTPPVGMNAYVVAGTTKELTVEDTFRGIAPFLSVETLVLALLFFFPPIVLWLPSLMG